MKKIFSSFAIIFVFLLSLISPVLADIDNDVDVNYVSILLLTHHHI